MKTESQIATAILVLAGTLFFALVVVPEIKEYRAARALQALSEQMSEEVADMERERAKRESAKRRKANQDRAARALRADERCVAGTVVRQVVRAGVPSYEQVLRNQRPVRCKGRERVDG
mgnify:CR=1 FL=1